MIQRNISSFVKRDLERKIVLISGPRQTGKTTLARMLCDKCEYLNYDNLENRAIIDGRRWSRQVDGVVFDELHKKKDWKRFIKGIYDVEGVRPRILITGSARLDLTRRAGDSLAGRCFSFRLYPFDHAELEGQMQLSDVHRRLKTCGGFPEPFLAGSRAEYQRWQRGHLDVILRQDLIELQHVRDVAGIQTLVSLLKQRVGSPISYASLARDLERDAKTVKSWIGILEQLYVVFVVMPWSKSVARSIRKEPKVYFCDLGILHDSPAAQLENMVALSLRKRLHFIEDCIGHSTHLNYLRTVDGKEIDFLVQVEAQRPLMLEVKTADEAPAAGFRSFAKALPNARAIQLVEQLTHEQTYPYGLEIRALPKWLADITQQVPVETSQEAPHG